MKSLILATTLTAFGLALALPVQAASQPAAGVSADTLIQDDFDKRRKPRIPGGSGCDDPGDVLEHPECRM